MCFSITALWSNIRGYITQPISKHLKLMQSNRSIHFWSFPGEDIKRWILGNFLRLISPRELCGKPNESPHSCMLKYFPNFHFLTLINLKTSVFENLCCSFSLNCCPVSLAKNTWMTYTPGTQHYRAWAIIAQELLVSWSLDSYLFSQETIFIMTSSINLLLGHRELSESLRCLS